MKSNSIISISVLINIMLLGLLFSAFNATPEKKTVYVNKQEVFDSFIGKKELTQRFEQLVLKHQQVIDSLTQQTTVGKKLILTLEDEFKAEELVVSQQYTQEVWVQINEYIRKYGQEQGYEYILGEDGSGTVMFAKEEQDITAVFISYLNQSYQGN